MKISFFISHLLLMCPVKGEDIGISTKYFVWKTRMVGVTKGEKV